MFSYKSAHLEAKENKWNLTPAEMSWRQSRFFSYLELLNTVSQRTEVFVSMKMNAPRLGTSYHSVIGFPKASLNTLEVANELVHTITPSIFNRQGFGKIDFADATFCLCYYFGRA